MIDFSHSRSSVLIYQLFPIGRQGLSTGNRKTTRGANDEEESEAAGMTVGRKGPPIDSLDRPPASR